MDDPGGPRVGLAPITLADKSYFQRSFSTLAQPISDYSFANTFIWSTSLRLFWAKIRGHLCVFANGQDLTMLMPPLPEPGVTEDDLRACLDECFQIMDAYNRESADPSHSRIEYVSDEMLERLSSPALRHLRLSATPMGGDYIYDMARMIDLAGGALKSKRHARTKFLREHPEARVEDLAAQHVPACRQLLALWQAHGDQAHQGEISEANLGTHLLRQRDTLACEVALDHWQVLDMRGMALLVGDQLVGFTLGEGLSPTQASIVIEKTHSDYPGAAQFIFSEFCRRYWAELPECNVGDDWGIPSLRFTKQSYRPIRTLCKYTLSRDPAALGLAGVPTTRRTASA